MRGDTPEYYAQEASNRTIARCFRAHWRASNGGNAGGDEWGGCGGRGGGRLGDSADRGGGGRDRGQARPGWPFDIYRCGDQRTLGGAGCGRVAPDVPGASGAGSGDYRGRGTGAEQGDRSLGGRSGGRGEG